MAGNIIEDVQEYLGIGPLQKVDPNTQEPAAAGTFTSADLLLAQGAVAAVLTGVYEKTRTEAGAAEFLDVTNVKGYLPVLFGESEAEAIQSVAGYSNATFGEAELAMQNTAQAVKHLLPTEITDLTPEATTEFFAGQRSTILSYLPASLRMGHLLENNAMDDHTQKMDGPVSGLVHAIENIFSSTK